MAVKGIAWALVYEQINNFKNIFLEKLQALFLEVMNTFTNLRFTFLCKIILDIEGTVGISIAALTLMIHRCHRGYMFRTSFTDSDLTSLTVSIVISTLMPNALL